MEISKRRPIVKITVLGCLFLVLLAADKSTCADRKPQKDANDPNELWLSRWEAVVKDPNNPNEMLQTKWQAVTKVLRGKELERKRKEKIIDGIMSPVFDFELMAKLALGKTHWPKLTAPQQDRFTQLFTELLKNSYRDKIMGYEDEKVLFEPAVREKNAIRISVVVVSDGKSTVILYKLRKTGQNWKIYDVEIEGISILLTYRSQFDDILSRGTVKDLLSQLEKSTPQE